MEKNQELEFERNKERFLFLKWGAKALKNMLIVPPGSGIVHQVGRGGGGREEEGRGGGVQREEFSFMWRKRVKTVVMGAYYSHIRM